MSFAFLLYVVNAMASVLCLNAGSDVAATVHGMLAAFFLLAEAGRSHD